MTSFKTIGPTSILLTNEVSKTTTASITTVSTLIVGDNPRRIGFVIYNNGANTIYLSFAPTSSGSTPTRPLATFASWECYGPALWTGPISGIRNSGSGTVTIWELLG